MLVSPKKMLQAARRGGFAIGAFNVNDMEILQGVITAAIEEKSPVIIQTSEGAINYAGLEYLAAMTEVAGRTKVPVAFHLDHGQSPLQIKRLIKAGFHTSVMFDGSRLAYRENVKETRAIVRLAHRHGLQVEAELGAIAGAEDTLPVSSSRVVFTDPKQAKEFAKLTNCDALAISVGTRHGAYKWQKEIRLDMARIAAIAATTRLPLVLHGASGVPLWLKRRCLAAGCRIEEARGIPDAQIRQTIRAGICKINVDTDLRIAFTAGVREALAANPSNTDPRKYLGPARDLVSKVVREKMRLFGCSGKAN